MRARLDLSQEGRVIRMPKAMLIMDMPSCCDKCPVHSINVFGDICCRGKDGRICLSEKPTWCPLRSVPQKKTELTMFDIGEAMGYNACIDEILGGGE